jgi:tetratricopeptide (TPR) repeat protein
MHVSWVEGLRFMLRHTACYRLRSILVSAVIWGISSLSVIADDPKWQAAKLKDATGVSYGKITATGGITVDGKFTDSAATYEVVEEKDKFVKLSDGKSSGWVFKVSVTRVEAPSPIAPKEPDWVAKGQSPPASRDPLIGTKVFWKDGAIAKVGNEVIDKFKVLGCPALVEDVDGEWLWLSRAWVRRSDVMQLNEAFEYYIEEVRRNPTSARAWRHRAGCWSLKGELNNAIKDFDEAIRLDPKDARRYTNRGFAKHNLKDYSGAIRDHDEAIRLDPKFTTAYNNRGFSKMLSSDWNGSIRDYDAAMQLNPKYTSPINNKSFLLSTCPEASMRDGDLAAELAERALKLGSKKAYSMNARACAYAAAGDFKKAIEWQKKAMEDEDFMNDDGVDGGKSARKRIAKWEAEELWLMP